MLLKKLAVSVAGLTLTTLTLADAPKVVADIAPVHSLVAQVMKGVGEPSLLIGPENSPHEYNLRPSEARALSSADVVFWIGEDLTPWLERSLDSLAADATKVSFMESAGTNLLAFREGATFEAHDHGDHDEHGHDDHDDHTHEDHGHEEHKHDDHDHDDHAHDDHGHEEHKHDDHDHDEHAHDDHGHDDHHGHSHDGSDPHIWLDPVNAQAWLTEIAEVLSDADPENAATYKANAKNAVNELDALITGLQSDAAELGDVKFVVFHDAYQYFETRFNVLATGAVSVSDAADPSPARVAEIRDTVADLNVTCVFTEPQFSSNLVKVIFGETDVYTGIMDPVGVDIETGEGHYAQLITNLMNSVKSCKR